MVAGRENCVENLGEQQKRDRLGSICKNRRMDGRRSTHIALDFPALPEAAAQTTRPTAVDLFCGAGGLSYAFHQAGFRITAAVEADPHAARAYQISFVEKYSPDTKLLTSDIRSSKVTRVLSALKKSCGTIDIVIGGPPCQDFSLARLAMPLNGERSTLVQHYFRVLKLLKPRAFLFENVPALRTAAGGKYWKIVEKQAAKLGYTVHAEVLCAEEYGVPQRRRRLFVVGLRGTHREFEFPPKPGIAAPTVREAIGHLPRLHAGQVSLVDPMHRARQHRPSTVEYLRSVKPGESWRNVKELRVLRCHEGHDGHYDVYGRMRFDTVAPTITGGCTNPSKGRFIHPTQHRGLTVREAALLQTFPEDWQFSGGVEAESLQVGNAVPIRLGQVLATTLRAAL